MAQESSNKKKVWSIRVSPELKKWFEDYAKERGTDPQEEARQALADYRQNKMKTLSDFQ